MGSLLAQLSSSFSFAEETELALLSSHPPPPRKVYFSATAKKSIPKKKPTKFWTYVKLGLPYANIFGPWQSKLTSNLLEKCLSTCVRKK